MSKEFQLSVDARALIQAFESAPVQTRDMVRIQLKIAVEQIRDYASDNHRYTSRTMRLERDGIGTEVNDNEGRLWLDTKTVPYARAIHEGRPAWVIVPRNKKALRWVKGNQFVFAKRVNHPALKPDQFLYEAVDHERVDIVSNFAKALQKLLEEL